MSPLTSTPHPYALTAGEGERLWIVGDVMTIKATAASTGGALSLFVVEAAPGGGPPPHTHEHEDEYFFVLDGEFEILLGQESGRYRAGDFAFVPRGHVHRFGNVGDAPARILVWFTPGGLEGFFRAAGTAATDDGPPLALDADEIARTDAVAAEYGLRIVGWQPGEGAR